MATRLATAFISIRADTAKLRGDLARARAMVERNARSISQSASKLASLGPTTKNFNAMTDAARKSNEQVARVTTSATRAGAAFARMGFSIGAAVKQFVVFSATITAITGAFRSAIEFDKQLINSLSIQEDQTEDTLKAMRRLSRQMAIEFGVAAEDVAQSFFFLRSAGFDFEQQVEALPTVTKFATAGMFDMKKATDLLTDAQKALGSESANLIPLADKLAKANQLGNASIEQFSKALTTKAAVSIKNLRADFDGALATLIAFANAGIKAERGGTALSQVIKDLSDKVIKNAAAFERLNIDIFDDATGQFLGMVQVIRNLEAALGDLSAEQRAVEIRQLGFNKRTVESIIALIGSTKAISGFKDELKKSQGTLDQIVKVQLTSMDRQLRRALESLKALSAIVAGPIVDAFVIIAAPIAKFAAALASLDDMVGGAISSAVKFTAVAGLLGLALVKLVPLLIIAAKSAATFVLNVTGIGPAVNFAIRSIEVISDLVDDLGKVLINVGVGAANFFSTLGRKISRGIPLLGPFIDLFLSLVGVLTGALPVAVGALVRSLGKLGKVLANIIKRIRAFLKLAILGFLASTAAAVERMITTLQKVPEVQEELARTARAFQIAWRKVAATIVQLGEKILGLFDRMITRLTGLADVSEEIVIKGFDEDTVQRARLFIRVLQLVQTAVFNIAATFKVLITNWRTVLKLLKQIAVAVFQEIKMLMEKLFGDFFERLFDTFTGGEKTFSRSLSDLFVKAGEGAVAIKDALAATGESLETIAKALEKIANFSIIGEKPGGPNQFLDPDAIRKDLQDINAELGISAKPRKSIFDFARGDTPLPLFPDVENINELGDATKKAAKETSKWTPVIETLSAIVKSVRDNITEMNTALGITPENVKKIIDDLTRPATGTGAGRIGKGQGKLAGFSEFAEQARRVQESILDPDRKIADNTAKTAKNTATLVELARQRPSVAGGGVNTGLVSGGPLLAPASGGPPLNGGGP